jgi:hypothetical protein
MEQLRGVARLRLDTQQDRERNPAGRRRHDPIVRF